MAELPKSWERMIKESIGAGEQQIAIKPEGYREIGLGEGLGNIKDAFVQHLRTRWAELSAPLTKEEFSDEKIREVAMNWAPMGMGTIAANVALRRPRNTSEAVELLSQGASRQEVLEKTGRFKIGDKMAWEFGDEGAKLRMGNFKTRTRKGDKTVVQEFEGNLGEGLEHTKLYENYPKMTDMPLKMNIDLSVRPDAVYHGMDKGIEVTARNEREVLELLGHEWQHGVSEIEGFPRGGMPEEFTKAFDIDPRTAHKMYREMGGEQLSNATAERLLMDDETRRIIPPWSHMKSQDSWINLGRGVAPSVDNPSVMKFFERFEKTAEGKAAAERRVMETWSPGEI